MVSVPRHFQAPFLGIEFSCDETAAAVLDPDGRILAEAVLSQEREHAPYGGVVPEIAARAHLAQLPDLVRRVMAQAAWTWRDWRRSPPAPVPG